MIATLDAARRARWEESTTYSKSRSPTSASHEPACILVKFFNTQCL